MLFVKKTLINFFFFLFFFRSQVRPALPIDEKSDSDLSLHTLCEMIGSVS